MSSLFNLPTSDSIPDPSSATDRITLEEVAPRSSSLDGAVTIEFTSSPSRWFSPSDSYLLIGCDMFSTLTTPAVGGTPESYAWQATPKENTGVVFAKGAGAAFFSTVSLQVNGVIMGTISNPAQIGGVLSLTEITNDYATTVGSSELLQTDAKERARNTFGVTDQNGVHRSAFEIVYRPPLGFLRPMKAFPGARITLTFNIAPEYGSRVLTDIDNTGTLTVLGKDVAAPTAATDHKVKLTSMKYYAAMMTPLNNPSIPSQVLLPMYEIASSAHQLPQGITANQLQTISFNVPASTFKIAIGVQPADAGTGIITASKDMARFHFPKVQHLSVNYAGYQGGSGAYTSARNSPERPYTDFCQSTLAAQQGRAASVDMIAWSEAPLYLFRFAKPANDVSSNATVRISFTETLAESVNVFCFAYYQSTAAISYDSSGMVTGCEYAYAS
jgi:hypothetical protein